MKDSVIFLCDSSPDIGFGHLNRCLVLARELHDAGENCIMVGPNIKYRKKLEKLIFENWIELNNTWRSPFKVLDLLIRTVKAYNSYLVVLDDYRIDSVFQKRLSEIGTHSLLFDNGKRSDIYSDIVINTNPVVSKSDYQDKLINSRVKLLLGPKYSLLRPEFPPTPPKKKSTVKKIAITFGGGDDRGAVLLILNTLLKIRMKDVEFIVVSGRENPNNKDISKWIDSHDFGNVELKINPPAIAELFALCDLSIMAGGTTVYEIASIGIPMILISIADNQIQHSRDWSRVVESIRYIGRLEDFQKNDLIKNFDELLYDNKKLGKQKTKTNSIVDGLGRARVASEIMKIKERCA